MYRLKNDRITLEFDDMGHLVSLRAAEGGTEVPIDADGVTAPFEIQLRDQAGEIVFVTPNREPEMAISRQDDQQVLTLNWNVKGEWGELAVKGTIRLPDGSPLSYWSLAVRNNTERAIFQAAFPRVSGLLDYKRQTPGWLNIPICMGEKTPNPVSFVNQHEAVIDTWARHQFGAFDTEGGPAVTLQAQWRRDGVPVAGVMA